MDLLKLLVVYYKMIELSMRSTTRSHHVPDLTNPNENQGTGLKNREGTLAALSS
jgi:hypothetical protein